MQVSNVYNINASCISSEAAEYSEAKQQSCSWHKIRPSNGDKPCML